MAKITIIMPTYRRYRWIQCAIESLLAQEMDDWRLHVVSDGSDQEKRKVVEQYGDSRILYSETEPTRGFGNWQRQYAILGVETPWVGFLDDDDLVNHSYLEVLLTEQNMKADMIRFGMVMGVLCAQRRHCEQIVQKASRMFADGLTDLQKYKHWIPCLESTEAYDRSSRMGTGSFIVRKELIQKHGWCLKNDPFSDWYSIAAMLAEKPVIARISDCLYLAIRRPLE